MYNQQEKHFTVKMSSQPRSSQHLNAHTRDTRYLNGLKGICALLVLITHHEHWGRSAYESTLLERSFGYKGHHFFATLPYIRIIFSGAHFGVSMFFTISGYVLSLRPLLLIRDDQQSRLLSYLGSAIFRRWLRLFLPVIGTIIPFLTLWHMFKFDVPYMERRSSYRDTLLHLTGEMCDFAWVFARDTSPTGYGPTFSYNDHLWSIPLELKGSMIVFISLVVTSSTSFKRRLICYGVLVLYLLYAVDGWYGAMFVMGTILCELDLESASQPALHGWIRVVPIVAFALGMYLAGVPHTLNAQSLGTNPGWFWLSALKPLSMLDLKWFYLFWASALVVWSSPRLPLAKSIFETRACQSLGDLSYSIYLIHGPILWTIGDHLYMLSQLYISSPSARDVPKEELVEDLRLLGFELAFSMPCLFLIIFTLAVARLHGFLIDVPSRKLSNYTHSVLFQGR